MTKLSNTKHILIAENRVQNDNETMTKDTIDNVEKKLSIKRENLSSDNSNVHKMVLEVTSKLPKKSKINEIKKHKTEINKESSVQRNQNEILSKLQSKVKKQMEKDPVSSTKRSVTNKKLPSKGKEIQTETFKKPLTQKTTISEKPLLEKKLKSKLTPVDMKVNTKSLKTSKNKVISKKPKSEPIKNPLPQKIADSKKLPVERKRKPKQVLGKDSSSDIKKVDKKLPKILKKKLTVKKPKSESIKKSPILKRSDEQPQQKKEKPLSVQKLKPKQVLGKDSNSDIKKICKKLPKILKKKLTVKKPKSESIKKSLILKSPDEQPQQKLQYKKPELKDLINVTEKLEMYKENPKLILKQIMKSLNAKRKQAQQSNANKSNNLPKKQTVKVKQIKKKMKMISIANRRKLDAVSSLQLAVENLEPDEKTESPLDSNSPNHNITIQ